MQHKFFLLELISEIYPEQQKKVSQSIPILNIYVFVFNIFDQFGQFEEI
jgi:hypothetical protein